MEVENKKNFSLKTSDNMKVVSTNNTKNKEQGRQYARNNTRIQRYDTFYTIRF